MSAWDIIKEIGDVVLGSINSAGSRVRDYENEYDYLSDDDLLDELRVVYARYNRAGYGSSDKMENYARCEAIINVLQSRGYGD